MEWEGGDRRSEQQCALVRPGAVPSHLPALPNILLAPILAPLGGNARCRVGNRGGSFCLLGWLVQARHICCRCSTHLHDKPSQNRSSIVASALTLAAVVGLAAATVLGSIPHNPQDHHPLAMCGVPLTSHSAGVLQENQGRRQPPPLLTWQVRVAHVQVLLHLGFCKVYV